MRRRFAWMLAVAVLVCAGLAGSARAAATLAPGFHENIVIEGRTNPTALRFGPNGEIFIAEKSGLVWYYDALNDPSPTLVVDLRASVHNFWDRGLLGIAVHPDFPAVPYLYVSYPHDTWPPGDPRFGDPTQPRWGTGNPSPSTADPCPTPPGPTTEGCVIYGRLSRIAVDPGTMAGLEEVMLEGHWCQQFPSHTTGDLVFGEDGYLYMSAGDGASFNFTDTGQRGIPVNPCGDPPDGVGGPNNTNAAEGGALRSQDLLTPATAGDPTGLSGAILRLDVSGATPVAPPDNPLVGNADAGDDFIIAIGLRNPFRLNKRPGTEEIWITDVGWNTWEEINRIASVAAPVENFGWPCYEGDNTGSARQSGYDNRHLCRRLYGELAPPIPPDISVTAPYFSYRHSEKVVPGELCGSGSSSATGILFYTGANFPPEYTNAALFADASRQCVWAMFPGADGLPDKTQIAPLVSKASGQVVDIQIGADGKLYYVDFDHGRIYRVEYFFDNEPPHAVIDAAPSAGIAPLLVDFSAAGSSDPEDGTDLVYEWDLDNDGDFDDASGVEASFTYADSGGHTVRLRVTDSLGDTGAASVLISVDNTPPVASILSPSPSFTWAVGDEIDYELSGSDLEDGELPQSQLSLEVIMHHCATPTNCHTHPITTINGVDKGAFVAPDHEYLSFIELRLTARDFLPPSWFGGTGWAVRRKLSFDNSAQSGTLVDFPVLVTLDPSRIDYARTKPGGADLRFADAAGNALAYEIEAWNPGGVSRVWVRVSAIAAGSTSDHVFMYYDNPAAADAQNPAAVWSNGYAGVWHLHADFLDSSANDNDLTNHGTTSVAGKIGNARLFNSGRWLEAVSSPSLEIEGELTIEAWAARASATTGGNPRLLSKKQQWTDPVGYNLELEPDEQTLTAVGSGDNFIRAEGIDTGTAWHYLATTVNNGNGRVYYDGADVTADDTLSPLIASDQPLNIGRISSQGNHFQGSIDEVRLSNVQRDAAWIAAQHLSMTDAFISYGSQEQPNTLTGTTSVELQPKTVDVTVHSQPEGLSVAFGGETLTTPAIKTVIQGSLNSIGALTPQIQGLALYDFSAWSDAGAINHLFTASTPLTLTATFAAAAACGDGLDNDLDGFSDAVDLGCTSASDTSEREDGLACDDGTDNDGDALADLSDPGCSAPVDPSEQNAEVACDDGADNDGDTLADLADVGCAGPTDSSEHDAELACDDGADNDGDGAADAADLGCADNLDESEHDAAIACDDGLDNDGDTQIDYPADSDCESATDTTELAPPVIPALPGLALPLLTALLLASARFRRR